MLVLPPDDRHDQLFMSKYGPYPLSGYADCYLKLGKSYVLPAQVHKRQADGQWQLELSPCVQVLARNKSAILKALADAKYDKITHVRQAVGKALLEMDCIPSPRGIPSLAETLHGMHTQP